MNAVTEVIQSTSMLAVATAICSALWVLHDCIYWFPGGKACYSIYRSKFRKLFVKTDFERNEKIVDSSEGND